MVKAYYDKNAARFQTPEQMKIEYVVLDPSVVEPTISVSDAEVAAYYEIENNKKMLATPEQRFASHIFVAVKQSASAAEKATLKAKADAILAELRKAPADFAALAKTKSDDTETAAKGGDLGAITKDTLATPEEIAVALKLKQGEISDVISSSFGFHIVTVTKLMPSVVPALDAVKPQIVAELKKSKMAKKFSEMAEQFNNTVFEQADSLKPVAEKLGLKIQTADHLGRAPSPALGTAPINNARFLTAIFSDEVLKNKRNTEAVEVAANTLVSGRVVEWKPAAKSPLAEVADAIRQDVIKEEAVKLARKAGEAKLAAAKASGDAAGFGDVKMVSRSAQPPIERDAAVEVMKADTSKLPAYVGVELPGMGYGVYRISKVNQPTEVDAAKRAALATEVNGVNGQLDTYAYIQALKAKAKAKLLIKPVVTADAK
jgi:peptidyl-prolyl cis-trans isomerase D